VDVFGPLGLAGRVVGGVWSLVRRQNLELSFDSDDTEIVEFDGTKGHLHVRFRVRNRGWRAAEDSSVLLTGVTRPDNGGVRAGAVPLRELQWADVDASHIVIQPRQSRLVDIAAVTRLDDEMLIGVKDRDPTRRDYVPPGRYELSLLVSARGARPRKYVAVVTFVTDWAADPGLPDHVRDISVQPDKRRT
jgi:hypothetical protein